MIYSCDGKADIQQPLLQSSMSHNPSEIIHLVLKKRFLLCVQNKRLFFSGFLMNEKEQHLFEVEILCNVFTVTID